MANVYQALSKGLNTHNKLAVKCILPEYLPPWILLFVCFGQFVLVGFLF